MVNKREIKKGYSIKQKKSRRKNGIRRDLEKGIDAYKRIIGTYNGNKDIYTLLYYKQTRFSCFITV